MHVRVCELLSCEIDSKYTSKEPVCPRVELIPQRIICIRTIVCLN